MGERKVLNKYYPPDFDYEKLRKMRDPVRQKEKGKGPRLMNVRYMFPFTMCCSNCGEYNYVGTKFNSRIERLKGGYLDLPVWRIYGRCPHCRGEIAFKTDPKSGDYIMEYGGTRNYQAHRDADLLEERMKEEFANEIEGDSMKALEHKTYNTAKEIHEIELLEELRKMNKRLLGREATIELTLEYLQNLEKTSDSDCIDETDTNDLEQMKPFLKGKAILAADDDDDHLRDAATAGGCSTISNSIATGRSALTSSSKRRDDEAKKQMLSRMQVKRKKTVDHPKKQEPNRPAIAEMLCGYATSDDSS